MDSVTLYSGMCDASAAVALDDTTFIVADDEKNTLHIYSATRPGPPVQALPWDDALDLEGEENVYPEVDIEGAAMVDGCIYWISSHGRNRSGIWRSSRHRFFGMKVRKEDGRWIAVPQGKPYKELATRLVDDPRIRALDLDAALNADKRKSKKLAPKKKGLNIEGLCAVPESKTLLIALRNPRPRGKALLVPLANPDALLRENAVPEFGDPILLDLSFVHKDKRVEPGVRSIAYVPCKRAYLIVAGPHDKKDVFALFQWSGEPNDKPRLLSSATEAVNGLEAFCPEALVVYPRCHEIHVLSDDGSRTVKVNSAAECAQGAFENGECEAKTLLDDRKKTFRSIVLAVESTRS